MKHSDPLAQAKIKAPPPALNASTDGAPLAAAGSIEPAGPEENPPSLDEEKEKVVVPTTEGQPRPRRLRVVGDEKKPYRVYVRGQCIVLRHGKVIDPASYPADQIEAFKEHGVRFEEQAVEEA